MNNDTYVFLLAVFVVALAGAITGAVIAAWWLEKHARIHLTVSAFQCNASAIADWLSAHGLVAMPKGPDFKPDARITNRVR